MPKLNSTLVALVVTGIVIVLIIGIYQILFAAPQSVPTQGVEPLSEYYGEDVFNFIQSRQ